MTQTDTLSTPNTVERTTSSRDQLAYEEVIRQIRDLPTLPEVVLRVTEMVNNPRVSAKDIGKVIAHDQVLTARLLKLVNSSYYGFPSEITKITTAIVILGFNSIKQLLLSTAVFDLFGKDRIEGFDRVDLLRHTIATAIASRMIGREMGYSDLEELFVAGLLHDIGKVVMDRYFHEDYREILHRTLEKDITFHTAEQDVCDCDHAVLGQLLARHWRLPEKLASIIAHHHNPEAAGQYGREAAIVHIADILAKAKRIGSGGDRVMPKLDMWSWELLALHPSTLETILAQLEDEFPQVISLFELEG
jgi:putative nucleotidyltransferase with HDIG domain